jgi:large subunit ribosomal protein L4
MAITVPLRTAAGGSVGQVTLDDAVFGIEPNLPVLHQVVTAQLAAARAGTHSTKTRAEVSGGGKKPYKQKGTGRARQGSTRAPHWVGGGVALGPKPRSYRQKTPKKMVQLALRSALSDRAASERVAVVDRWPWEEPKTAEARRAVAALGFSGRVLVVLDRDTDGDAYRSFRNLSDVQVLLSGELNAYDILCNDWVVFSRQTLPGSGNEVVETADGGAGEAAVDEAPVEEAAVDDAAVDEAPVEQASVDEAPVDEAAVDEAAVDEAPVEQALDAGPAGDDAAPEAEPADPEGDAGPSDLGESRPVESGPAVDGDPEEEDQ